MTIVDGCESYLNGEISAISLIRTLSGIFRPEYSSDLLVMICAITRVEEGDLTKDDFRSIYLKKG